MPLSIAVDNLSSVQEPNVALKAIDVEETQKVDTKPQGTVQEWSEYARMVFVCFCLCFVFI